MSTDVLSKTSVLRNDRHTVTQLLAAAEKDTDAVSVFMAGPVTGLSVSRPWRLHSSRR